MRKILYTLILVQILILIGIYANYRYFLSKANEIKVLACGYDPRDIFMGNYVMLNYDFSNIGYKNIDTFKKGDEIYVYLNFNPEEGIFRPIKLSKSKSEDGIFLSGIYNGHKTIKFGIEKYYTSQKNSSELEKKLINNCLIANLAIDNNGKALIKSLSENPKNLKQLTNDLKVN